MKYIVLLLSILANSSIFAYQIETENVQNKQIYRQFIDEAISLLPKKFMSRISSNIRFKFQTQDHSGRYRLNEIILNEKLFVNFINNPNQSQFVEFTRHNSFKNYLISIIIHELSHAYDFTKTNNLKESAAGRNLFCLQNQTSNVINNQVNPNCHSIFENLGVISGDPEFLNLTFNYFYGNSPSQRERGNFLQNRSADPYEFKNPIEAFAVNMEFFILDPQFKCKKPAMFAYLFNEFQESKYSDISCSDYPKQFYISTGLGGANVFVPEVFTPKGKLYQIHYLLAGAGEGIMSGFGHSMLRLIYCDPDRDQASEACLQDFDQHIVITPGASVLDFEISKIDGMTGKYWTYFFARKLSDTVLTYNRIEERDLISLPLVLTESEMNNLETSIIEAHWTYKNRYYFLTNNCAVEILNVIKRSMPYNWNLQSIFTSTPVSLFEELRNINFFDKNILENIKNDKNKRYYFPSAKDFLEKTEDYLAKYLNNKKAENYRSLLVEEREKIVLEVKQSGVKRKNLSAAIETLENNILLKLSLNLTKKVISNNLQKKVTDQEDSFKELKKESVNWVSAPDFLNPTEYGIPSLQETNSTIFEKHELIQKINKIQKSHSEQLAALSKKYTEFVEIQKIQKILNNLSGEN